MKLSIRIRTLFRRHKQGECKNWSQVLMTLLSNPTTQLGPIDSQGHTPLWDAMVMGDAEITATLRARGAPVQPDTAMQMCKAAAQNNVKFIELLLMHNVNVLARVRINCSTLQAGCGVMTLTINQHHLYIVPVFCLSRTTFPTQSQYGEIYRMPMGVRHCMSQQRVDQLR